MGKAYNMNPALILLSLSIWGSLMGVIGLVLALPLTTVILSYYKQLIINKNRVVPQGPEPGPDFTSQTDRPVEEDLP